MDDVRKRRVIRGLADIGMVEMKATGHWGLTADGRQFVDQMEVLRELDDRPGAATGRTPQAGGSAPPRGARQGDDVRAARAHRERTKGGRHTS